MTSKPPNPRNSKPNTDAPVPATTATSYPKLDIAELIKRKKEGLCFECNEKGHRGRDCPVRAARLAAEAKNAALVAEVAQVVEDKAASPESGKA